MSRAFPKWFSWLLIFSVAGGLLAEKREDPNLTARVENWVAPTHWVAQTATVAPEGATDGASFARTVPFVALEPCRLADTRGNGFAGAYGPPSLSPGVARNFVVGGQCGVPPDAAAVSFNFTVVRTQGLGYLVAYPQGGGRPGTSTLNYVAGQIVANNAVVGLLGGAITAEVAGQGADLLIDINGYYGGPLVTTLNGLSGDLSLAAGDNFTITPSGGTLILSASSVPGPQGPAGPIGPQGLQGLVGPAGSQGLQGLQGPIGLTGSQGSAGAAGTPGEAGATGPAGPAGMTFQGAWSVEGTYAIGDAVSYNGSTYLSLVPSNADNQPDTSPSMWALLAQRGDAGLAGAEGPQGIQGLMGLMGPQGPIGATGAQGPAGAQGPIGLTGSQGSAGAAGTPGEAGAIGPAGPAGMTFQGVWSVEGTYAIGDAVTYNGSTYLSLVASNVDNQPDTSPSMWALLAQRGDAGVAGVEGPQGIQGLMGPMGPQGLIGATGSQGPAGAQGPNGATGSQGSAGAQGPIGLTGSQGPAGPTGPQGAPGTPGVGFQFQSFHDIDDLVGNQYMSPVSTWEGPGEIGKAIGLVPAACTMTAIAVFVNSPVRNGGSETFVLRVGTTMVAIDENEADSDLADTSLMCTVTQGSQSCTGSSTVPVAAGQIFDFKVIISGGHSPQTHDALVAVSCQ